MVAVCDSGGCYIHGPKSRNRKRALTNMNRTLRILTYLLVLAVGMAAGLGLALYLQLLISNADMIYPARLDPTG